MARTTKTDVLIPEIFTDAVSAAFAQKNALHQSVLVSIGAAHATGSFPGGADAIGNEVEVPYFGTLGEFEENIADGNPATPKKIQQTSEKSTVTRDTLAFEATRWSRNAKGGDAYEEAAKQVVQATARAIDKRLITALAATGSGLVKSAHSTSAPRTLDYDLLVDALALWGDEADDVVGMVVHSRVSADLYKLRDASGKPFLTQMQDGGLPRFMGIPIATSDRVPLVGSAMSPLTMAEAGTSPPDITLSGAPLGAWDLRIIISVGGSSNGTAKFKFSVDGGLNYSAELTVPNGGGAFVLTDTAIDSLVGVNGATGITATFTNGTYNVDNVYTSKSSLKARSLILRRNAGAFWYNQAGLRLQTDRDILVDSDVGAVHLYGVAHRYRRRPGGTKPGVVVVEHNVGGY